MLTIIHREITEKIHSLQFITLFIVATALFIISSGIFIQQYSLRSTFYEDGINETHLNPSTARLKIFQRPNPLGFVADGGARFEPAGIVLTPKGRQSALESGPENFKLDIVPELDWAFLFKIIFSLYALLLTFRSVSGEKEQGTLRLILANSLSRPRLLIAKYLSTMILLTLPIVTGMLISLIYISFSMPEILTLSNLLRITGTLLLTLAYLSIFVLLGLLASTLIEKSSVVLLSLLSIWIFMVIIIPNTSGILADTFSPLPSEYETSQKVGPIIQNAVWEKIDGLKIRIQNGEFQSKEEIIKESNRLFQEGQIDVAKHYHEYENAMQSRSNLAANISRFSPTALFQYAAQSMVNSGPDRETWFRNNITEYSETYDDYILSKVGELVGTSYFSFSTSTTFNGEHVNLVSPEPKEYDGNKSDFPHFIDVVPPFSQNIRSAMLDFCGILIWNLLLASCAILAIRRCDVR
ncbi:ABC transporter permease subunit [bacterium]|nr:ABC transporter permease subunit [bacterium]